MKRKLWIAIVGLFVFVIAATLTVEEYRMTRLRARLAAEAVRSDWAAAQFALQFIHGQPVWYFNRFDLNQAFLISRLQRVYSLTDAEGRMLERSTAFDHLPLKVPTATSSPQVWEASGQDAGYLLCTGLIHDQDGRAYQLTVGRRRSD